MGQWLGYSGFGDDKGIIRCPSQKADSITPNDLHQSHGAVGGVGRSRLLVDTSVAEEHEGDGDLADGDEQEREGRVGKAVGNGADKGTAEDADDEEEFAVTAGVVLLEDVLVVCKHDHGASDLVKESAAADGK